MDMTKTSKDGFKENENKETVKDVSKSQQKRETAQGDIYGVEDLAAAAKSRFDTQPECVTAAFKLAGKTEATVEEAKKIINDFLNKEVG